MKEPTHIIPQGTRVRTHDQLPTPAGMLVADEHLRHRVASAPGVTVGIVGGHGGDVYWVRHEDGSVAPYGWHEFELEVPLPPGVAPVVSLFEVPTKDECAFPTPTAKVRVRDGSETVDVDCSCGAAGCAPIESGAWECLMCGFALTWKERDVEIREVLPRLAPTPHDIPDDINPGIRRLVGTLNRVGYDMTDSGDGETHDHECDRDYGYVVVIVSDPRRLVTEAHHLKDVLGDLGIRVVPQDMGRPEVGCCYMQAMYCPVDGFAVIDVSHVHDRMLAPEDPGNVEMTCIKCGGLVVTAAQPPGVDVLPICAACRAGDM